MNHFMFKSSLTAAILFFVIAAAVAQTPPPADVTATAQNVAVASDPNVAPATAPVVLPDTPFTGSFMFSPLDLSEIARAKAGVIIPSAASTGATDSTGNLYIPPVRRIVLSGVYYKNPGDWIAWINGQKVTPSHLLPEIVDIKVVKDRVSLQWFDIGLNGVISITLRPRQVYDIGTGVTLTE